MYTSPEPPDELLQVFDEAGNPTQALPRSIVKAEPRVHWCAVVNVWLINKEGEILCSKRSKTLKGNPDKWQTYFGGHLKAGQSYQEAVIAEMDEEVGLAVDPGELFLVNKGTNPPKYHTHFESYIYPFDGAIEELQFNDGEIVDARWMKLDAYFAEVKQYPDQWCNGINPHNESIIKEWIQSHSSNR